MALALKHRSLAKKSSKEIVFLGFANGLLPTVRRGRYLHVYC